MKAKQAALADRTTSTAPFMVVSSMKATVLIANDRNKKNEDKKFRLIGSKTGMLHRAPVGYHRRSYFFQDNQINNYAARRVRFLGVKFENRMP